MDRHNRGAGTSFSAILDDDVDTLKDALTVPPLPAPPPPSASRGGGSKGRAGVPAASFTPLSPAEERNDSGVTPLQLAASLGSPRCVRACLAARASVLACDVESTWSAMHRAAYSGHLGLMLTLHLHAGCPLDDASEAALLHPAKRSRSNRSAWPSHALVARGVGMYDAEGHTPLDLLQACRQHLHTGLRDAWAAACSSRVSVVGRSGPERGAAGEEDVLEDASLRSWLESMDASDRAAVLADMAVQSAGGVHVAARPVRGPVSAKRREKKGKKKGRAAAPQGGDDSDQERALEAAIREVEAAATGGGSTPPAPAPRTTPARRRTPTRRSSRAGSEDEGGEPAAAAAASTRPLTSPVLIHAAAPPAAPAQEEMHPEALLAALAGEVRAMNLNLIAVPVADAAAAASLGSPFAWTTTLHSSGVNENQLGYATTAAGQLVPRAIDLKAALGDDVLADMVASRSHNYLLTSRGRMIVFGSTSAGRLGLAIAPLDAGSDDSDASDTDLPAAAARSVRTSKRKSAAAASAPAGSTSRGGGGAATGRGDVPTAVLAPSLHPWHSLRPKMVITCVATSERHSLAVDAEGHVFAWGDNAAGACGAAPVGTDASSDAAANIIAAPLRVEGNLRRVHAVAVAAGSYHSVVLANDGSLWTFGSNFAGQCGNRDIPSLRTLMDGTALLPPSCASSLSSLHSALAGIAATAAGAAAAGVAATSAAATSSGGSSTASLSARVPADIRAVCMTWTPRRAEALAAAGRITHVHAAGGNTGVVTSAGEVFYTGNGRSTWMRVGFDAAAAALYDAVASVTDAVTAMRESGVDSVPPMPSTDEAAAMLTSMGFHIGTASREGDAWLRQKGDASRGPSAVIRSVSLSKHHAAALDSHGCVWVWGETVRPELSARGLGPARSGKRGGASDSSMPGGSSAASVALSALFPTWTEPRRVAALSRAGLRAVQVSTSIHHTLVLCDTGDVYAWGDAAARDKGLLGALPTPAAVSVSTTTSPAATPPPSSALPRKLHSVRACLRVCAAEHHNLFLTGALMPPLPPLRPARGDIVAVKERAHSMLALRATPPSVRISVVAALSSSDIEPAPYSSLGVSRPVPTLAQLEHPHAGLYNDLLAHDVYAALEDASVRARESADDDTAAVARTSAPVPAMDEVALVFDFAALPHPAPAVTPPDADAITPSLQLHAGSDGGLTHTPSGALVVSANFIPSLRSLAEHAMCKHVTLHNAISVLEAADTVGADGLATFAATLLSLNADSVLASCAYGRAASGGAGSKDREALLACAPGLLSWTWLSPHNAHRLRTYAAARHGRLVSLYKAFKRVEHEMMRPASTWRGASRSLRGGAAANRSNSAKRARARAADTLATLLAKPSLPTAVRARTLRVPVSSFLDATDALSDDATYAMHAFDHLLGVFARDVAHTHVKLFPEAAAAAASPSDDAASATGEADDAAQSFPGTGVAFQDAYDALVSARRGAMSRSRATAAADDADEDAHLDGVDVSMAHSRAAAASAAVARVASTALPSTVPPSAQASLDRIAANLMELARAPAMHAAWNAHCVDVTGEDMEEARSHLTQSMLDDAVALLKRVKAVRKKLVDATSTAAELASNDGSILHDQRQKLGRRGDYLLELWTLAPYIAAVCALARDVIRASGVAPVAGDAFLVTVREVERDAAAALVSFTALEDAGLTLAAAHRFNADDELAGDVVAARAARRVCGDAADTSASSSWMRRIPGVGITEAAPVELQARTPIKVAAVTTPVRAAQVPPPATPPPSASLPPSVSMTPPAIRAPHVAATSTAPPASPALATESKHSIAASIRDQLSAPTARSAPASAGLKAAGASPPAVARAGGADESDASFWRASSAGVPNELKRVAPASPPLVAATASAATAGGMRDVLLAQESNRSAAKRIEAQRAAAKVASIVGTASAQRAEAATSAATRDRVLSSLAPALAATAVPARPVAGVAAQARSGPSFAEIQRQQEAEAAEARKRMGGAPSMSKPKTAWGPAIAPVVAFAPRPTGIASVEAEEVAAAAATAATAAATRAAANAEKERRAAARAVFEAALAESRIRNSRAT